MELIEGLLLITAAILGFLSASFADFVKNWRKKGQLRRSLYKEIVNMWADLRDFIQATEDLRIKGGSEFKKIYIILSSKFQADRYRYATKSNPMLFDELKEASDIDSIYDKYLVLTGNETRKALDSLTPEAQLRFLHDISTKFAELIEKRLKDSMIDKELLLEVSDPSNQKLLEELIKFKIAKKWWRFWKN
ncbi:MAG: hypothetical protein WCE81_03710 [Halobacteriota archaeon]